MKVKQKISLLLLAVAIFGIIGVAAASAAGEGSQKVEHGYGNYERVYPTLLVPRSGECGSDDDDIILQYSTYWGPRVNPDNARWNSGVWWVNLYLERAYSGGLSASGLKTTTTRVCVGYKGQVLGPGGLESVYLWHN